MDKTIIYSAEKLSRTPFMTDSLGYWFPLAKELARILTPLAGKTDSSVKGSSDFASVFMKWIYTQRTGW